MLSVIVPASNEADYIADCLNAVFASDPVPGGAEVVVVANGCRDRTADVARGLSAQAAQAYASVAPRLDRAASWACACTVEWVGIERVLSEAQWRGGVAFGLFASLCPERALSAEHAIDSAQRLYGLARCDNRQCCENATIKVALIAPPVKNSPRALTRVSARSSLF